jgi:hypothetical protein
MSNSNTNLKHVIRSYKEENTSNIASQNIAVDSPQIKQIPTSKRSKRQSLTNKTSNNHSTSNPKLQQQAAENGVTNF